MTRNDFIKVVTELLNQYIFEGLMPGENPHLRVNPQSYGVSLVSEADFLTEIADNDEAIEDAAAADRAEAEDASDWQSAQNPDFYPVSTLITTDAKGVHSVNAGAVARIADRYTF